MGLALVSVFLYSGSMSTSAIVEAQTTMWWVVPLFPAFVIYVISMVGETNRAPFDLPEAEGELVGGFHTEYSSLKFALFFLAEYVNMVTVSALATTLFLGGWQAPWPLGGIVWEGANTGWWPVLWFIGKLLLFLFVFIWLRGTLPRLRYDQFMRFGWKRLIPFALLWIVLASVRPRDAAVRRPRRGDLITWIGVAAARAVGLFLAVRAGLRRRPRRAGGGARGRGRRRRPVRRRLPRAADARPDAAAHGGPDAGRALPGAVAGTVQRPRIEEVQRG